MVTAICDGCHVLAMGCNCISSYEHFDKKCPCINCIVKPMCTKACDEYNQLAKHIAKRGLKIVKYI